MTRSACPIRRRRPCETPARERTPAIGLRGCFGSWSMGGWQAMRMSTTPTGWPSIRSGIRSWVAVLLMRKLHWPRRWAGSRLRRWPWPRSGKREALADLNGQWVDRFHDRNGQKFVVQDMDSSVSPTHGDQEGSAWNNQFDCTCYHPNFLFNQFGMLERCALRPAHWQCPQR